MISIGCFPWKFQGGEAALACGVRLVSGRKRGEDPEHLKHEQPAPAATAVHESSLTPNAPRAYILVALC